MYKSGSTSHTRSFIKGQATGKLIGQEDTWFDHLEKEFLIQMFRSKCFVALLLKTMMNLPHINLTLLLRIITLKLLNFPSVLILKRKSKEQSCYLQVFQSLEETDIPCGILYHMHHRIKGYPAINHAEVSVTSTTHLRLLTFFFNFSSIFFSA